MRAKGMTTINNLPDPPQKEEDQQEEEVLVQHASK
jgi:hypothetical protein